jgi:hypothetical protein
MWPLAIAAGIVVTIAGALLAGRARRAGRRVLAGLADLVRWPAFGASVWVAIGLAGHSATWTLTWQALAVIGGGLLGTCAYLAGYATYRFYRTSRHPATTHRGGTWPLPSSGGRRHGALRRMRRCRP